MHILLNEMKELAAQKKVPHRDFYNIRKVRDLTLTLCFNAPSTAAAGNLISATQTAINTTPHSLICGVKYGSHPTYSGIQSLLNVDSY